MSFALQPWQLLIIIFASWVNRQQQEVIEYLRTENHVLKEKIGKKRLVLNDDQRRRLAVKGKILGRKMLQDVGTLFTPDTILRWHRMLVAQKWDYSDRRKSLGRPCVKKEIVNLVLQFARENPGDTTGFKVLWRTSVTTFPTRQWAMYSNGTESNRFRIENAKRLGRRF